MKNGWGLALLDKVRSEQTIDREAFMESGRKEERKEEIITDDTADFICSLWTN